MTAGPDRHRAGDSARPGPAALSGLSLVNPSASPTLQKDEARWIAIEMHRALEQTARP